MQDYTILQVLESKVKNQHETFFPNLFSLTNKIIKRASDHLDAVSKDLQEFDNHDKRHSEKVVENIEQLLGHRLEALSEMELSLLIMSAYLHDCGMALFDCVNDMFKLTEGRSENNVDLFQNDGKAPFDFTRAKKFINDNKSSIYKSYSEIQEQLFVPDEEADFIEYLVEELIKYQVYRNGYVGEFLNETSEDEYDKLSKAIKINYIRETHSWRIGRLVPHMESLLISEFSNTSFASQIIDYLSPLTKSHGDNFKDVASLEHKGSSIFGNKVNLQFLSMMLRLGDIIHYSYDRAPIDLRALKKFVSINSYEEWAVKEKAGVTYTIKDSDISFSSYSNEPYYYFKLDKYLKWIDGELQNYHVLKGNWDTTYNFDLPLKVNREAVRYNRNEFEPKLDLEFKLDRSRILELLMGKGLYKNKYACLRELYQNALDACRCMQSINKVDEVLEGSKIEFGIKKDKSGSYIYCLDNGIGMDKYILENFFLKIGDSYYNSPSFHREQARTGYNFTPISQFGIGILSCFMIGNKIEVITKKSEGGIISCGLDGPYDKFYYINNIKSEDKIQRHGTLIKVYLSVDLDDELHVNPINKIGLGLLHEWNNYSRQLGIDQSLCCENSNKHLFYILLNYIYLVPDKITVAVKCSDDSAIKLPNFPVLLKDGNCNISLQDYGLIENLSFYNKSFYEKWPISKLFEEIQSYTITVESDGVIFKECINLPKKSVAYLKSKVLSALPWCKQTGVCVDGIYITGSIGYGDVGFYSESLSHTGIIDFKGRIRPTLSVDRTSIIEYPKNLESCMRNVTLELILEIIKVVDSHLKAFSISRESELHEEIWEYLLTKYHFCSALFLKELATSSVDDFYRTNISKIFPGIKSIRDYFTSPLITIDNYHQKNFDDVINRLIIYRLSSADKVGVDGNTVTIEASSELLLPELDYREEFNHHFIFVKAHTTNDTFKEYDIITSLYPIIPDYLYSLIPTQRLRESNCSKYNFKKISAYGNSIFSLFMQDVRLVHQTMGLYTESKSKFVYNESDSENDNFIFEFNNKRGDLQQLDLGNRYSNDDKKSFFVAAFISPIELNKAEQNKLKKLEETEPQYVKGVTQGWSVLVTGMDYMNMVICPGKCSRKELVSMLPDDFWDKYNDYEFKFPDGSNVKCKHTTN